VLIGPTVCRHKRSIAGRIDATSASTALAFEQWALALWMDFLDVRHAAGAALKDYEIR
jgi:hypothetical protein